MLKCQGCEKELIEDDCFTHLGQTFCEDCYIERSQRIRICDPWAERSKLIFRESQGLKGTDGLTDLQKQMYEIVKQRGEITREDLASELEISGRETENQVALLRHCQLLKGKKVGQMVYIVPW